MADRLTYQEALLGAPRLRPVRVPGGPKGRSLGSKVVWSALFATLLGISLWFGAPRRAPSTPTARMEQIASQLRCPVCIDESAAQANTAAARAIRADIAARLREGQSDQAIIGYMVSRYGRWILLSPSTSGFSLTVWVAPIAVTLGALGVVAVAWGRAARRWKPSGEPAADDEGELAAEQEVVADQAVGAGDGRSAS